jgi:hypothetical protein
MGFLKLFKKQKHLKVEKKSFMVSWIFFSNKNFGSNLRDTDWLYTTSILLGSLCENKMIKENTRQGLKVLCQQFAILIISLDAL